jgi:tetratricopeptide (TPR) repeat protein
VPLRTSALSLLGFVAVGGACARTPAPPPVRPNADGFDLRQLAAEMDDPSAAPLWPTVPADLKKLVAARIPTSLSPAERRRLGEEWVSSPDVTERCDGRDPRDAFLAFLAGWALLEELAWSPTSDERVAAAGPLYDRLRREPFTSAFREGLSGSLKSLAKTLSGERRQKLEHDFNEGLCLGPVMGLIADHTVALERHFGAQILRGGPSASTTRVLRDEAARRSKAGEFRRALPLAAEAARLLPRSSDAWLELSKVSYQVDEVARGDDALKQALALGADVESPPVREATRFQVLAHEPLREGFEQSLARFWALFAMERFGEARALIDPLRRQRPDDARAFLGDVLLKYTVRSPGDSLFDVVHAAFLSFSQAGNLRNRDADYDRTYLSLAFQEALSSLGSVAFAQRPIWSDPEVRAAIGRARSLSRQLAPNIPGDVAIYDLAVDILATALPDDDRGPNTTRALGQLFPRALEVYTAYPSQESYRVLLGLAMLTDDWTAASAAITAPLRFDPAGDDQIALFRARAFVTAAFRAKDWNRLLEVSGLLAAVPRWSDETNNQLDLLRSDALMLRAVHGEKTLWREAARGYNEISWAFPAWDKARAANNAPAIVEVLSPCNDTSSDWSSLRAVGRQEWPVLVNGAAAEFRAGHRGPDPNLLECQRHLLYGDRRPQQSGDLL